MSSNYNGIITKPSIYSAAETIDRFSNIVESKGFKIFAKIDHSAGAKSIDLELRPTVLLIFGNPQGGTPLMQASQTMGLDLPLKALAYEDENGQTHLAYNSPAFLAERHGVPTSHPVIEKMTSALDALTHAASN